MSHRQTRSSRKVPKAVLAFTTAAALLLAACGGGQNEANNENGGNGEEPRELGQFPGELADAEPQYGGSVTYALEAENGGGWCIPAAQLAIAGIQVARAVYDTLTIVDANGEIQPHLAESVEPNDDFTEWTITLREGIKFHDDSDLNAEVVRNNIAAAAGLYEYPEGQEITALLLPIVLEMVDSVEATGPMEVKVTTSQPWAAFDSYLFLSGRLGIVAQAQLDSGEDCYHNLIGTGPFEFDSWNESTHDIHLTKNDQYWRTDHNGNELPYLDEVNFKVILETQQAVNALNAGDIDAFHTSSNTDALLINDLAESAESGDINLVHSDRFAELGFLMLNVEAAPFDNLTARQAAAHALDRQTIADEISGGLATPASGIYSEDAVGHLEDAGYPEYDEEAASELVQQYEDDTGQPFEFTITYVAGSSTLETLVNLTQDYFEAAGMTVNTTTVDQTSLIGEAIGGNYQAMTFRNFPGLPADNIYTWFYGGSPVNFSRIDNEEINTLLDEGRAARDPEEQQEIYSQFNQKLNEELPMLWASPTDWAVAAGSDIYGFTGSRPADATDTSLDYPGFALGQDPAVWWRAQD